MCDLETKKYNEKKLERRFHSSLGTRALRVDECGCICDVRSEQRLGCPHEEKTMEPK